WQQCLQRLSPRDQVRGNHLRIARPDLFVRHLTRNPLTMLFDRLLATITLNRKRITELGGAVHLHCMGWHFPTAIAFQLNSFTHFAPRRCRVADTESFDLGTT